jgi:GTP-binding protein
MARLGRAAKKSPLLLSGVSGEGVTEVLRALFEVIEQARLGAQADAEPVAWQP